MVLLFWIGLRFLAPSIRSLSLSIDVSVWTCLRRKKTCHCFSIALNVHVYRMKGHAKNTLFSYGHNRKQCKELWRFHSEPDRYVKFSQLAWCVSRHTYRGEIWMFCRCRAQLQNCKWNEYRHTHTLSVSLFLCLFSQMEIFCFSLAHNRRLLKWHKTIWNKSRSYWCT